MLASKARIIYTPPPELRSVAARWANWLCRRRNLTAVFSDEYSRARAIAAGFNPAHCRLIPPGVCPPPPHDRAAVRRRLGLSDDDFVVLAPGESTQRARHSLAIWTLAILYETDHRWKMLAWGKGPLRRELSRMATRLKARDTLHTAENWKFDDILPAADAALITASPGAAVLPTALCMAAGIPIAATPNETLTNRRNALVIEGDSPRAAAQALLELRSDNALRASLAGQAQTDAAAKFAMDRFVEDPTKKMLSLCPPRSAVRSHFSHLNLTRPDSSHPAHAPR